MRYHATPHTRSRCERLTDRTASGPEAILLLATLLFALLHPAAVAVGATLLAVHRLGRRT